MPPGEADRVVVWSLGDALLAAPLAVIVEIATVAADGRAMSRLGPLDVRSAPGLPAPAGPRRAVVVRTGEAGAAALAIAADDVEGVKPYTPAEAAATPAWLRTLPTGHIAGMIRLDDDRIAALLAIEALPGP